jgi:putative ABC transport system ATP-binding protein
LVNNPSILITDEPTGNLDSKTSREVIRIFRELNEQSKLTVIIVTHDQTVAHNADRIVVLGDGEIIDDTTNYEQAIQSLQSFETAEPVLEE